MKRMTIGRLLLILMTRGITSLPVSFVDDLISREIDSLGDCTRVIIQDPQDPFSRINTEDLLQSTRINNGPRLLLDMRSDPSPADSILLERRFCQIIFVLLNPCSPEVFGVLQGLLDRRMTGLPYHYVMKKPLDPGSACNKALSFFSYTLYLEWWDKIGLVTLYELSPREKWIPSGYWSPKQGLRLFYPQLFENKFSVDVIKTACIAREPPIYTWVAFPNGTRRVMGYVIDMYDYIVRYSGNTYKLIPIADDVEDVYGKVKNGSWVGVMGMLVDGEVEVIASNLAHTKERYAVADHTYNIIHLRVHFAVRKADLLPKWRALFWPYDPTSWYVILASIIATILVHRLILRLSDVKASFSSSFMNTISILFGRGFKIYNEFASERILLIAWMLYTMIIIYGYVGLLKSSLVAPVMVKEVKTYMDLAMSNDHSRLSFKKNGYFHNIMRQETDNAAYQIMLRNKKIVETVTSYQRILSLYARKTDAALNILDSVIELLGLEHEIVLSKETIFIGNPYFYVQNNSRYKDKFNLGLNYYRSSGLDLFEKKRSIRFFKKLFKENYKLANLPKEPKDELTLYNVQGSFFGLLLGLALSIIAFGLEALSFYLYKKELFNSWR